MAAHLLFKWPMTFKAPQFLFLSLLLPLMVTGLAPAQAQMSCKQAYRELRITNSYDEPLAAMQELYKELLKFGDVLNKANELTSMEIQWSVLSIGPRLETYFKAAGISFERSFLQLDIGKTKDSDAYLLNYPGYVISGSRSGDLISRLIFGAQASLKSQKHPANFVFDPLYSVRMGNSGIMGHFRPDVRAIVVGPMILSQTYSGVANILRHEIHHYLEHLRLLNGEMSLQRMQLRDDSDDSKRAYNRFLSADELETHLRDLRFETNHIKMEKIDQKLEGLLDFESLFALDAERAFSHRSTQKNMENILRDTKEVMPVLLAMAAKDQWKFEAALEENQGPFVVFQMKDVEYPMVVLNLFGLVEKTAKPEQVQKKVIEVLQWNQRRIENLELQYLKIKEKEDAR